MRLHDIFETLTFKTSVRGVHSSQQDLTIIAMRDGQPVGHIDYSDYHGAPAVQMLHVAHHRKGLSTALKRLLQRD